MTLFTPWRYRSLPYSDSIRILRIVPSQHQDAPIRCLMDTRRLSEAEPLYETLSYTWGDASDTMKTFIGDGEAQLEVTRNCYSALKSLRLSDTPRMMWIDAICINQNDNEERTHQVRMMDRIYASATRTIVYLGEATCSSRTVFKDLSQAADGPFKLSKHGVRQPDRSAPSQGVISGLEELINRPWFYRIWVQQEVYVSDEKSMLVMCGPDYASWLLFKSCLFGYEKETLVINRSALPGIVSASFFYNDFSIPAWWNLWRALGSTRQCQATDPRDKVFALRALVGPGSVMLDDIIDYSRSLESVLIAVAEFLLPAIGLTLLLAIRHRHSRVGLASWVPDWSQTQPIWGLDAFGIGVRRAMGNTSRRYVEERPHDFSFSFCKTLEYSPGILYVDGWLAGSITSMGAVFRLRDVKDARQQLESIQNAIRRLKRDDMISGDYAVPPQIDDQNIVSAFNSLTTVEMRQLFTRGLVTAFNEEELHSMTLDWLPREGEVSSWTVQEAEQQLNGCKFFTVGERLIGIAPEATQESDVLCIVKNAFWPCILRPAPAGRWQLISGDCYLMDLDEEVGYKEVQFSVGGEWDGPRIDGLLEEEPERLELC